MTTKTLSRFLPLLLLAGALGACTAEVEDPGEPPEVNVEPGRAPDIDVEPADVEVSTDTQKVVVPDIDVVPDSTP